MRHAGMRTWYRRTAARALVAAVVVSIAAAAPQGTPASASVPPRPPEVRRPGRVDVDGAGTGDVVLPLYEGLAPARPALQAPAQAAAAGYGVSASLPATVRRGVPVRFTVAVQAPARARVTVGATGTGFTGCGTAAGHRAYVTVPASGRVSVTCPLTPLASKSFRVVATVVARSSARVMAASDAVSRVVRDGVAMPATAAADLWRAQAQAMLSRAYGTRETTLDHSAATAGFRMRIDAARSGWRSRQVAADYAGVLAFRKPNGGWGLGRAYDAFGDGTVNPADTAYLVTTVDHVGRALLEGYTNGVVPREVLEDVLATVVAFPTVPAVRNGTCLSYSDSGFDDRWCTWNVTLGAGAFLKDAADAGVVVPGQLDLVDSITRTVKNQFNRSNGYWPYTTGWPPRRPQDTDHNGYTLESAKILMPDDPDIQAGLDTFMETPPWQHPVPPPTQALYSFGYGLSRGALLHCSSASSPAVLEAYGALRGVTGGRFQLMHAAYKGYAVLGACLAGS